eukprot:393797-Amorphochlora_amoeboformis.AAC.2
MKGTYFYGILRRANERLILRFRTLSRRKGTEVPKAATPPRVAPWRRFAAAYERSLEARPVLTKSITGGILFGLGDILGQNLSGQVESKGFDSPRFARAVLFGGVFYPLPAHIHYNFLEVRRNFSLEKILRREVERKASLLCVCNACNE